MIDVSATGMSISTMLLVRLPLRVADVAGTLAIACCRSLSRLAVVVLAVLTPPQRGSTGAAVIDELCFWDRHGK